MVPAPQIVQVTICWSDAVLNACMRSLDTELNGLNQDIHESYDRPLWYVVCAEQRLNEKSTSLLSYFEMNKSLEISISSKCVEGELQDW